MHALVVRQLRHLDTLFGKQSAFVFAQSSKSANNSKEKEGGGCVDVSLDLELQTVRASAPEYVSQ